MVKKEPQQATKYRPKVGEKIVCFHHDVMYEAKVLTVRQDPDDPSEQNFFVHYQGWSKSWDEWVDSDRVLKCTDENIKAAKESQKNQNKNKASARKNKLSTSVVSLNTSSLSVSSLEASPSEEKEIVKVEKDVKEKKVAVPATKTTASDVSQRESQIEFLFEDLELKRLKTEVKIKLPEELKIWLIDDDNNVKNKKLSIIPAKSTISAIFKDYVNFRKTSTKLSTDKEVALNECMLGLKYYFNVMIGAHLLYKFERPQYQSLLKDHGKDVDLTTLYGAVHLLRMLTKIGVMMAYTTLDNKDIQVIVGHIMELLKFIKRQTNLFDVDKNYQVAPPEYIRQYQRAVD